MMRNSKKTDRCNLPRHKGKPKLIGFLKKNIVFVVFILLMSSMIIGCGNSTRPSDNNNSYKESVQLTETEEVTTEAIPSLDDVIYDVYDYAEEKEKTLDENAENIIIELYEDGEYDPQNIYSVLDSEGMVKTKRTLLRMYEPFYTETVFENGYAWVRFRDDNSDMAFALIDENFDIHYKVVDPEYTVDDKERHLSNFDKNGYAYYRIDGKSVIIDSDFNVTYRTQDTEELQSYICGHGDAVFILYKEISNFSEHKKVFVAIDPYGNELFPETEVQEEGRYMFDYKGEGIFCSDDMRDHIYNINTGAYFELPSVYDCFVTSFENGVAYFNTFNETIPNGTVVDGVTFETVVVPENFESLETYKSFSLTVTVDTPQFVPEVHFPDTVEVCSVGTISGQYYPVVLLGADEYYYYTIVDADGITQYDPIKLPFELVWFRSSDYNLSINESRLAYIDEDNYDIVIIDTDGTKNILSGMGDVSHYGEGNQGNWRIKSYDGKYIYRYSDIVIIDKRIDQSTVYLYKDAN